MSDHGAAQNLPVRCSRLRHNCSLEVARTTQFNREDGEAPESSKPIDPQQWTRGKFGQSLGEKEEGNRTPVFGAKRPDHLQQNMA